MPQRLTDQEYEDVYRESLRCLADAGNDVGVPQTNADGVRICIVNGKTLNDRGLIESWWSPEITRKIFDGR